MLKGQELLPKTTLSYTSLASHSKLINPMCVDDEE